MKEYMVVYEEGTDGWSAFLPDIDGVYATGKTRAEVEARVREAVQAHVDWLRRDGDPIPKPTCHAGKVKVRTGEPIPA